MKLYADTAGRRVWQIITDVLVVLWTVTWIRLAQLLHDLVSQLAVPGRILAEAGGELAEKVGGAGEKVAGVPGIGDDLRGPFDAVAAAGADIAGAGRAQQEAVADLAVLLSGLLVVLVLSVIVLIWLPLRVRWVRRATTVSRLLSTTGGLSLLALRALANRSPAALARVADDPVDSWQRGDAEVVKRLAVLELKAYGLRAPGARRM